MSTSQPTPFRLARQIEEPRFAFRPADPEPVAATEKYRPRILADIVGQGAAVWQLQEFLEAPYSCALFFEGETGTGKTTAALCLAAELGAVEFGGLEKISSGTQDAEAVEKALDRLRFTPMLGSGWKVVVVDEADWMSPKASQVWLSALEDLPPRSVIAFTTNHPGKFPARFLDRCVRVPFESDARLLAQDASALIARVWQAEGREGKAPRLADLPGVVDSDGHLSFRRAVQAVANYRPGRSTPAPAPKSAPVTGRGDAARKAWETRRRLAAQA